MNLIAYAARNRAIFVVHQQVPTMIIRCYDVASVDQLILLNRAVLQVNLSPKSLHL